MEKMTEAPSLACANCGALPSDHNITAAPERMLCRDRSGQAFEYTDDRKAFDLLKQLEALDARREQLSNELFLLMEPHLQSR